MGKEFLSIKDVIDILKKRIILIAIIIVVAVICSAVYSFGIAKPQYRTTAKMFIGKEMTGDESQYNASEVQMYQKLIKSYAGIATSEDVVTRAVENADLDVRPKTILSSLSAVPGEEDQFLILSVVTLDNEEGVKILEAVIKELMATSEKLIPKGSINVLTTPKAPTAPFSPNKKMNILVAFAMGLMLSVTLALFLEYLDNSVKNKDEIEKILGVPVIGMVPEYNEKMISKEKAKASKTHKARRDKKCRSSKKTQEVSMQSPLEQ